MRSAAANPSNITTRSVNSDPSILPTRSTKTNQSVIATQSIVTIPSSQPLTLTCIHTTLLSIRSFAIQRSLPVLKSILTAKLRTFVLNKSIISYNYNFPKPALLLQITRSPQLAQPVQISHQTQLVPTAQFNPVLKLTHRLQFHQPIQLTRNTTQS